MFSFKTKYSLSIAHDAHLQNLWNDKLKYSSTKGKNVTIARKNLNTKKRILTDKKCIQIILYEKCEKSFI